jgi:uncharacterized membrane protein
MNKTRIEAFSDGVFAIIITIMVLELKIPGGTSWEVLRPLLPKFLSYLFSFIFIAIYWGNHHHLMHTAKRVSAGIIWGNAHLLFWLSLIPFFTGWMGENKFDRVTVAAYAAELLMCGVAYGFLSSAIKKTQTEETDLSKAIANGKKKEWVSTALYAAAIPVALYVSPAAAAVIIITVSIIWIVPSREIEQALEKMEHKKGS